MKTYTNLTKPQLDVLIRASLFYIKLVDILNTSLNSAGCKGYLTEDIIQQLILNYKDDLKIKCDELSYSFEKLHLYFKEIIDESKLDKINEEVNVYKGILSKAMFLSKSNDTKFEFDDEHQMRAYREILEYYSRFLSGQIDYLHLPEIIQWNFNLNKKDLNKLKELTSDIKHILFVEMLSKFGGTIDNVSYGIGQGETHCGIIRQIAYEMYREIYVFDVKNRADNGEEIGWTVYSSPTLKYSKEPLPIIHKIK